MQRHMRRFGMVAVAVLAMGATAAEGQTAFVPQTDTHLTAETGPDARITDADGRTVLLRGINVVQIGDYFQNDPAQPARFDLTEQDFADIAASGFNHVRLILHWSLLEPAPGQHDEGYLDVIRQALDWARAHDLYVVLDMHQDAWGKYIATPEDETCVPPMDPAVGWDGAPEWATLTDGLPTCKVALRELSPAVAMAWQSFWLDRDPGDGVGIQTRLVETWEWLVDELGPDPVIAGYDPLNEPSPGFAPGISETVALGAFYSDVLDGIRGAEADDGRPVPAPYFFEPGVEWSAGSITAPPVDPGFVADDAIVFAPHIYAESISPVSIPQGWDNAELVASVYGATVWTGEWGYFSASPADDDDPLRRFAAEEDARLLHSAFWDWRQACGDPHNFYPDRSSGRILSPSFVRYECPGDVELGIAPEFALVLSRSHPRAVPGTLTSTTSDIDTGALTVTGSTDAPGIADLWLPDRGTGNPVVDGGEVVAVHRVPATDRAAGGWRVQLRVEGDYTITAAVDGTAAPTVEPTEPTAEPVPSDPAPDDEPGSLPATGAGMAAVALGALGLAGRLRAIGRRHP